MASLPSLQAISDCVDHSEEGLTTKSFSFETGMKLRPTFSEQYKVN